MRARDIYTGQLAPGKRNRGPDWDRALEYAIRDWSLRIPAADRSDTKTCLYADLLRSLERREVPQFCLRSTVCDVGLRNAYYTTIVIHLEG